MLFRSHETDLEFGFFEQRHGLFDGVVHVHHGVQCLHEAGRIFGLEDVASHGKPRTAGTDGIVSHLDDVARRVHARAAGDDDGNALNTLTFIFPYLIWFKLLTVQFALIMVYINISMFFFRV